MDPGHSPFCYFLKDWLNQNVFGTELTEINDSNILFMFIVHFVELFIYLFYDSVCNLIPYSIDL
jgi:hypothetical protein